MTRAKKSRRPTRVEKKAKKAIHSARRTVEAHDSIEQRAVQVLNGLQQRVRELEEVQERFRGHLFGAFLAKAIEAEGGAPEPKFSDALMQAFPEWFKGREAAPWMAFSQRQ